MSLGGTGDTEGELAHVAVHTHTYVCTHTHTRVPTDPSPPAAAENVLKRMTIIGEILSFRAMAQQGLREVGAPQPTGAPPRGTPTHSAPQPEGSAGAP